MSTSADPGSTSLTAPIVTLGPSGSGYLIVEPSADAALEHLSSEYGDLTDTASAPADLPALSELAHYDAAGRRLHIATQDGSPTLTAGNDQIGRGALCARVEETFAYVRALAYGDESILQHTPADHPGQVRPPDPPDIDEPSEEAYDTFFEGLLEQLRSPMPHEHKGSWWHNLFHR